MRVLVTGGLGFVGRAVAVNLLAAGHDVDVMSRGGSHVKPPDGAELVMGDVRDRPRVTEVVAEGRYDGICHLAALTRARDSFADPLSYYDVNLGGTLNLLLAISTARTLRFVLASSSIVYGLGGGQLRLTSSPGRASAIAATSPATSPTPPSVHAA